MYLSKYNDLYWIYLHLNNNSIMPPFTKRKSLHCLKNNLKLHRITPQSKGSAGAPKLTPETKDETCLEQVTKLVRPSASEGALACVRDDIIPYRLRPKRTPTATAISSQEEKNVSGYRIVSMEKLEVSMNTFLEEHSTASPGCKVSFGLDSKSELNRGICTSVAFRCLRCQFVCSPHKLYNEQTQRIGSRGPLCGDLNIRFALALQNTGVAIEAGREILATLDIPCPATCTLQKACNFVSDKVVDLSEQVMADNRAKVRSVLSHSKQEKLIAESDVSYNNAPKGRSFYQPGTQAFCPLVENATSQKLIIAHNTVNKLCKRCQLHGQHHKGKCSANYGLQCPIGNAERVLGGANAKVLLTDESPLIPNRIVTDNDGSIFRGMKEIVSAHDPDMLFEKQDCTIHISRGQMRLGMGSSWSAAFAGKKNTPARKVFVQDMVHAVCKRSSAELNGARTKYSRNDVQFKRAVQEARETIVSCMEGNHDKCNKSFICPKSKRRTPHQRHMPKKQDLPKTMKSEDRVLLQKIIDYKLCDAMIERQLCVANTNKCEAFHNKMFRSLPKHHTYSRNVYGRVGTQVISGSMGRFRGVVRSCDEVSAPLAETGPGRMTLRKLAESDKYYSEYGRKNSTKRNRKFRGKMSKWTKRSTGSLYNTSQLHPTMTDDHSYGLRKGKHN